MGCHSLPCRRFATSATRLCGINRDAREVVPYGVAVRIHPQFWCCGESISKNAFRRFESVYRPEMPEMHLQNFEKLQSRKKHKRFHSVCAKRNFIYGEAVTSLGASPLHLRQRLNIVHLCRGAAMKLPLRANDVACATQMMLCLRHK